ncbi:1,3-beta-glucanase, partial [Streptomyces sp. NPDC005791]
MRSPRLPRRLVLSVVMALGLATLSTGLAQSAPTPVTTPAAHTASAAAVTFADEFDGPAGSAVDGGKWQTETGDNV